MIQERLLAKVAIWQVALPRRCCSPRLSMWLPQDSLGFLTPWRLGSRIANVELPGLWRPCAPLVRTITGPAWIRGLGGGCNFCYWGWSVFTENWGQADSLIFRQRARVVYPEVGSAKGISALARQGGLWLLAGCVRGKSDFQDTFVFSWVTILLVCSEDLLSP